MTRNPVYPDHMEAMKLMPPVKVQHYQKTSLWIWLLRSELLCVVRTPLSLVMRPFRGYGCRTEIVRKQG